jgi:hypothetical protein
MVSEYLYEESRVFGREDGGFQVRDPDAIVMPGLVPGIHVFGSQVKEDVDGRDAGAKRSFVASPAMTTGPARPALCHAPFDCKFAHPSLRATGSGECPPDDRLREAIQNPTAKRFWIASSLRSSQ